MAKGGRRVPWMCLCTIFYDNNQNNFSNGAAWSTMKNDVTDGAIYFKLFLSCQIFRKKITGNEPQKKTCQFYWKKRQTNKSTIQCFHMTSRRPYWCPKTIKRSPCWCPKPILWELNSFLMQTLSFVPINLQKCWPREWKHSIFMVCDNILLSTVEMTSKYVIVKLCNEIFRQQVVRGSTWVSNILTSFLW